MGRLTSEMKVHIKERYSELRSYSKVADELGLDPKTVAKYARDTWVDETDQKTAGKNAPQLLGRTGASSQKQQPPLTTSLPKQDFATYVSLRGKGLTPKQITLECSLTFEEVESHESNLMKLMDLENYSKLYQTNKDRLGALTHLSDYMEEAKLDPEDYVKLMMEVRDREKVRKEADALVLRRDVLKEENAELDVQQVELKRTNSNLLRSVNMKDKEIATKSQQLERLKQDENSLRESIKVLRKDDRTLRAQIVNSARIEIEDTLRSNRFLLNRAIIAFVGAANENPNTATLLGVMPGTPSLLLMSALPSIRKALQPAFDRIYNNLAFQPVSNAAKRHFPEDSSNFG